MDRQALVRVHGSDVEWQDDLDYFQLGEGVQVKVLYADAEAQQVELLVKFSPGYVEPRHVHDSTHSVIVLEGLQIAEGEHMRPGDYEEVRDKYRPSHADYTYDAKFGTRDWRGGG